MENAIFSSECACVFDLIINAVPNKQLTCSLSFFNSQRHSFDVGVKKISRILKNNASVEETKISFCTLDKKKAQKGPFLGFKCL